MLLSSYGRESCIGEGAYGKVFLVKAAKVGPHARRYPDHVVVKEIALEKCVRDGLKRPTLEAELLSRVRHPNVIALYDWQLQADRGKLVMVTEYANGGDLFAYLSKRAAVRRPLSEQTILSIFSQLCLGVKSIHDKNILHRDIKSKNIFLHSAVSANGDGKRASMMVKLGDFGIAKHLSSQEDLTTTAIGTPYYLSAEMCRGEPYGFASDIWSLGVVLFELITLQRPFEASKMSGLVSSIRNDPVPDVEPLLRRAYSSKVSLSLRSLLYRMLHKNPAMRPTISDILTYSLISKFLRRTPAKAAKRDHYSGMDTVNDSMLGLNAPTRQSTPDSNRVKGTYRGLHDKGDIVAIQPMSDERTPLVRVQEPGLGILSSRKRDDAESSSKRAKQTSGDSSLRKRSASKKVGKHSIQPPPQISRSVYNTLECIRCALARQFGGNARLCRLYELCILRRSGKQSPILEAMELGPHRSAIKLLEKLVDCELLYFPRIVVD